MKKRKISMFTEVQVFQNRPLYGRDTPTFLDAKRHAKSLPSTNIFGIEFK